MPNLRFPLLAALFALFFGGLASVSTDRAPADTHDTSVSPAESSPAGDPARMAEPTLSTPADDACPSSAQ